MQTYIALLRGINVGGNNVLPMKSLVSLLEEDGCQSVKTYIQSGNVVFKAETIDANKISEMINMEFGCNRTVNDTLPEVPSRHYHQPFNRGRTDDATNKDRVV